MILVLNSFLSVVSPLVSQLSAVETKAFSFYGDVLQSSNEILDAFKHPSSFNDLIISLDIWRKPLASLSVSPILNFEWTKDKRAVYWSNNWSVSYLIHAGLAQKVGNLFPLVI